MYQMSSTIIFSVSKGPVRFKGPDRYGVTTFRQNQGMHVSRKNPFLEAFDSREETLTCELSP